MRSWTLPLTTRWTGVLLRLGVAGLARMVTWPLPALTTSIRLARSRLRLRHCPGSRCRWSGATPRRAGHRFSLPNLRDVSRKQQEKGRDMSRNCQREGSRRPGLHRLAPPGLPGTGTCRAGPTRREAGAGASRSSAGCASADLTDSTGMGACADGFRLAAAWHGQAGGCTRQAREKGPGRGSAGPLFQSPDSVRASLLRAPGAEPGPCSRLRVDAVVLDRGDGRAIGRRRGSIAHDPHHGHRPAIGHQRGQGGPVPVGHRAADVRLPGEAIRR